MSTFNRRSTRLVGWQIVNTGSDNPPDSMTSYEVYSLAYCLDYIREHDARDWRLLPVFEGDVEDITDRTAEEYNGD